jgi:quercetin dioxygenase-like cupin family protein
MVRYDVAELLQGWPDGSPPYREFLRTAVMSAGLYRLPAGGPDRQGIHHEDELYLVLGGRATVTVGDHEAPAGPGCAIYVPAGVPHRFYAITEDLDMFVIFAPPESAPTVGAERAPAQASGAVGAGAGAPATPGTRVIGGTSW